MKGKSNGISFVVAYAPTDSHKSLRDKDLFWTVLGSTVAEVPKGEHLVVMMDANARTGRRGEGRVDGKVMGAYGQGARNDNGRRLLAFSAENQLALVNTFFRASKRGITYTFQSPNAGKDRCLPPGLYPHAANRQNMVRNVTVRRST